MMQLHFFGVLVQRLLVISIVTFLSACNGVFYQPNKILYGTPEDHGYTYKEISLRTSDAHNIFAWEIFPPDKPSGIVLHFHGNAQNMSAHFLAVEWLLAHNFMVVMFDYRGFGKSEGVPSRASLLEDARTVLRYAEDLALLNKLPFFVYAQSLGGAVALPSLVREQYSTLRAVAIEASFYSYRSLAREKLASFWLTWMFQYPLSWLLIDDSYSPKDFLKSFRYPLLVLHSEKDRVVPYEHGKYLYENAASSCKYFVPLKYGHIEGVVLDFSKQELMVNFFRNAAALECKL